MESDSGEYVCEIETYGSPIHQTSRLEILGKFREDRVTKPELLI